MGVISSVINMLFETWFIYYNLIKIKDIKDKKVKFFISVFLSYVLSSIAIGFIYKNQVFMLLAMTLLIYIFMKLLYKNVKIIDLFFIYYSMSILYIFTILTTIMLGYTIYMMIINRIIALIGAHFTAKLLKALYLSYEQNWDRGNNHKIKSITLRNISILIMNFSIFGINICILEILLKII